MWIINLTDQLQNNNKNYYVFNPSIICLPPNTYSFIDEKNIICLITYRLASYDVKEIYHPWKIWDNGYKYFSDSHKVKSDKYRDNLGKEIILNLESKKLYQSTTEYDSTGLAIFTFNGNKFNLKYNIANLFENEMNQDTRIYYINNQLYLTYNTFEDINNPKVRIRQRKMNIYKDKIILSSESYLFNHIYKNIEKNCVYDHKLRIQYEIKNNYTIIENNKLINKKFAFNDLINYYGKENIFISLSTPFVKYKDKYLCCGHIKVVYKNILNMYPFNIFMSKINLAEIHKHGKYMYFMFLYTYDETGIVDMSPSFIPSINNNHLPYILVMPCGMTKINDKYIISYGEGDCKTKILILTEKEIDYLLNYNNINSPYGFYFLSEYLKIMHIGYWNHKNCGDDVFIEVFKYIKNTYYPLNELIFVEKYDEHNLKYNSNINILGGGDVINKYFLKN